MAEGSSTAATPDCASWQRGFDCAFSEDTFLQVTLGLWLLTSLACLGLPSCLRMGRGPALYTLLLAAGSSACVVADAFCRLAFGSPAGSLARGYNFGMLSVLGSLATMLALRTFGQLWFDVFEAVLAKVETKIMTDELRGRLAWVCRTARRGHDVLAALQLPFAVAFATHLAMGRQGAEAGFVVKAWKLWLAAGPCIGGSCLGLLGWRVANALPEATPHAAGLRKAAGSGLMLQVTFDVVALFCWLLSASPKYEASGGVQGGASSLALLLLWLPHLQLLLGFGFCQAGHPLRSAEALAQLLACGEGGSGSEAAERGKQHADTDKAASGAAEASPRVLCSLPPTLDDVAAGEA